MAITPASIIPDEMAPLEQDKLEPPSTASFRVFNTTELLENILIQDDSTIDVTRARQINHFFRAVIDQSKALRRVMFLEPEPACETVMIHHPGFDLDPLGTPKIVTKLHPAISLSKDHRDLRDDFQDRFHITLPPELWKPGSWRSMLICQPPCKIVMVCCSWRYPSIFEYCEQFCLMNNTLGSLVAEIDRRREEHDDFKLGSIILFGRVDEASRTVKHARGMLRRLAIEAEYLAAEKFKDTEDAMSPSDMEDTSASPSEMDEVCVGNACNKL